MNRIIAIIAGALIAASAHAQQVIKPWQGGTGVSQANTKTITLGGALVTSGAFATTFSVTGTTSVILPTTGTLATLAGAEEFTTKTLNASVGKGTWTASGTWVLPAHTVNGTLTSSATGNWLLNNGCTTSGCYGRIVNTSGDLYWTVESSAGGSVHTGVGAYESSIGTSGATAFHLITSNNSRVRVAATGYVDIGGGAVAASRSTTNPTNAINIYNGTAPVGTLTNGVTLYSASGELRVMDAAGNSTLLSPHDDITNEWIFDSTLSTTGRHLRIDVERILRFIDARYRLNAVRDSGDRAAK